MNKMIKIQKKNEKRKNKALLAFTFILHLPAVFPLHAQFELEDVNLERYRNYYNSLPSVEDNDAALKASPQFIPFLKNTEEIITRYELEYSVGLRLIHRHFTLSDNQVMSESYELVQGTPSLVTQAHSYEEAEEREAIPASWIFSNVKQEEPLLLEASTDSAVRSGSKQLQKSPEFFDEMSKLLQETQLNNLFSVAILRRDSLVAGEEQSYMEVNSHDTPKSVVQIWNDNNTLGNTIRTSWSFKGPRQQRCWPILKCVWVPDYPEGRHRYLHVGHGSGDF